MPSEAVVAPEISTERKIYSVTTSCCKEYIEWRWGERPKTCPICGNPYFDKPGLEFDLFTLQDKLRADFAATGSTKILGEQMFPLILEYAENLIKGLLKGKVYLREDVLAEKANDASTKFLESYYRSGFKMDFSFGELLKRWCKNVAFGDQDHDKVHSLQFILGDSETEFGETITRSIESGKDEDGSQCYEELKLDNTVETCDPSYTLSKEISSLIRKTADIIREDSDSSYLTIMYLIGITNRVSNKTEKQMNAFYEYSGSRVRLCIEKGELVMFEYLKGIANGR